MLETDRGEPGKLQQGPQLRVVPAEPPGAQHWRDLSDAGNELGFCSAWLALLCGRMPGVTAGLLLVRQPSKEAAPLSVSWPTRDLKALGELSRAASQAYHHRRTITAGGGETAQDRVVAIPLGAGGEPVAAVALRLPASAGAGPHDLERLADELRWGAGWLEALPWARRFQGSSADMARALSCLDLLALVGEQSRLQGTAIAIANDLAARLRCDRVAFGIRKRNGVVRVTAISHSASFKDQGPVANAIGQAMEEAADQDASVAYPPLPSTERASTMAHRALAELVKMPGASVLSVVLADNKGTLLGAITLERHAGGGFDAETLRLAEAIAALLGPIGRAAGAGKPDARRPDGRFGWRGHVGPARASPSGPQARRDLRRRPRSGPCARKGRAPCHRKNGAGGGGAEGGRCPVRGVHSRRPRPCRRPREERRSAGRAR